MLFLNFLAQIPRGVPTLIVILSIIAILVIRKHTRGATGARARLRAILYLGFGLLIDLALVAELLLASDWLINNGWMPPEGFRILSLLTGWPISSADVTIQ